MRAGHVIILTVLLLMAIPAQAAPGGGPPGGEDGTGATSREAPLLYLRVGTFDPVSDPVPGPAWLHAVSTSPYYVVQFDGPVRDQWLEQAGELGMRPLQYLPDHAFFARVPEDAVEDLADLPHVRYVGPVHPAYRIHPGIQGELRSDIVVDISILTWDASRTNAIGARVQRDGGLVRYLDVDAVVARLRLSSVPALVADPSLGIRWVEPWAPPEPVNDNDARTAKARQQSDGTYISNGHAMWSYDPTGDAFEGYTGANVTVAVADTGMDTTHPAFAGRIVEYYDYGGDGEFDTNGHGTHVAGTVLGDGSWRTSDVGQDGKYAGLAPEARLVVQEVFVAGNPGSNGMGRDAESQGVTISSNSWIQGNFQDYNGVCEAYDRLTHDANNVKVGEQPILYVFGAGNDGSGDGTIRPPSLAKNVVSVGATGNDKWGMTSDTVADFSSRGPVEDGRIKPDVLLPGNVVSSTRSMDPGASAGWARPADGQDSYVYGTGTSMATPGVAGAAAVATQYLREELSLEPSPALLKAVLINGAVPLQGYEYPGNEQGWGRVDLEASLLESSTYRIYREDQETELDTEPGSNLTSSWFLVRSDRPLKVTLVWTDLPGTVNSAKHLINDLDLEMVDPDGNLYSGNSFKDGVSLTGTSFVPDRTNNVEGILVNVPKAGLWNLRVRAQNVPSGTQDFALVVSGNVEKGHVDLVPRGLVASPGEAEEGHTVRLTARADNAGNRDAAGVTYRLERVDPSGVVETLDAGSLGGLPAGAGRDLGWNVTGVRGDHTFRLVLDPGSSVLESDEGNNVLVLPYFFRGYDVGLTSTLTEQTSDPGQVVTFRMTLTNGGNVPDELMLDLSGLPPGWQGGFVRDSYTLDPSGTEVVMLDLMVPTNATAGESARLTVTATSSGNVSRSRSLELVIVVNQVFGLEVASISGPQTVLPGQERTLELMVRNTGNGPDVFTLAVATSVPAGWELVLLQPSVEVALRSETRVNVLMRVPEKALVGTSIEAQVSITSTLPSLSKEVVLSARVLQLHDSRIAVVGDVTEGDVGETIVIPVTISNSGNGPVTYMGDINFPDGSWVGGLDIGNLTIPAYSEGRANLTFVVPDRALNRSYDFTMVIIPTGEDIFLHEFQFTVRQFHDLALTIGSSPPTVTQGQTALVRVGLENRGNGLEGVSLTVDAPGTWTFEFTDGFPEIEPFADTIIDLRLDVHPDTPGGVHQVEVLASYGPSGGETALSGVAVTVLTRPDLTVPASRLNISETDPSVDMIVRITAAIVNLGDTEARDVFVQLYVDGIAVGQPLYLSTIDPHGEETLTFVWTTNRSGTHEVKVVADDLGGIDETDEGNNEGILSVDVSSLELRTSPGATVLAALLVLISVAAIAVNRRGRDRLPLP